MKSGKTRFVRMHKKGKKSKSFRFGISSVHCTVFCKRARSRSRALHSYNIYAVGNSASVVVYFGCRHFQVPTIITLPTLAYHIYFKWMQFMHFLSNLIDLMIWHRFPFFFIVINIFITARKWYHFQLGKYRTKMCFSNEFRNEFAHFPSFNGRVIVEKKILTLKTIFFPLDFNE